MTTEAASSPDLLNRARNGDATAFCELCRPCETPLLRQATVLCGDPTQAEDLAQETLVEAWKSLPRYDGRCQFLTWLCAILLNRYRNSLRKKKLLSFLPFLAHPEQSFSETLVDDKPLPDETIQRDEQAALIRKCIQALPPKHREVIYLRFYVDDSLDGIAAALGVSVGTVKSRLFNALDKLRAMKTFEPQFAPAKKELV